MTTTKPDARIIQARLKAQRDAAANPPYCNTGGYDSCEKIDLKNMLQIEDISLTAVDWLRLTNTNLENFNATMSDLCGADGIMASANLDVKWSDKGLHGYERSASIMIWKDNDYLTVGHIGTSERGRNAGGMFELTGTGCKILQLEYPALWLELFDLLQYQCWRISRVDVALDLSGEYATANGYTVPKLFQQAVNDGLFKSDNLRNPNMQQSFSMAGDWSALAVGNLSPDTYDPLTHCPAGLTAYIGNRKSSDDFFRVYEKGKELLGRMAEPEDIDRGWIRIEHEMSRKASGREIPLDVMIRPDHYFAANRGGVRAILDQLRASHELKQAQQWQREQFQKEKGLLLSKKVHWARHSYGRLFRTLTEQGISAEDIISWLSRADGLKEFVFDIAAEGMAEPSANGLPAMTTAAFRYGAADDLSAAEAEARDIRLERAAIQLESMEATA